MFGYNPVTYKKKHGPPFKAYFIIILFIVAVVGILFQGESLYYRYLGDKSSRLKEYLNTFYYRIDKNGHLWAEIIEPLMQGMDFVKKMLLTDPSGWEVHYYRAEYQYLLARLELSLDEFKILKFASRPGDFQFSFRISRFLIHSRIAALKSLVMEKEHQGALYAKYIAGFSYLFTDDVQRKIAFDYFGPLVQSGFQAREKFHELYWPAMLAAMFAGEGGIASDCLVRSTYIREIKIRAFLRGLILYHEKRYTDAILVFEELAEQLENKSKEENPQITFLRTETYRYLGKIYFKQSMETKGKGYLQKALQSNKEDIFLRKELEKYGISGK